VERQRLVWSPLVTKSTEKSVRSWLGEGRGGNFALVCQWELAHYRNVDAAHVRVVKDGILKRCNYQLRFSSYSQATALHTISAIGAWLWDEDPKAGLTRSSFSFFSFFLSFL